MAKTYSREGSVVKMVCPATGEAAPTTSLTDGQAVNGLKAITVCLSAEDTRTLSATGSLACYVLDNSAKAPGAIWMRQKESDIDLTVKGVSGVQYNALQTFDVLVSGKGRVLWLPVTVGISAGTNVTVYQIGQLKRPVR